MLRSLYAGVSGLQNHQTRMDVVGNNVANINTVGFKKGRVRFQDLVSQSLQGSARPGDVLGGVNPQQVGLGMRVATIDTMHLQGSLQTTGEKADIAIQKQGFFVLRNGDQNLYTRAGSFSLDADGSLVNPANGMRVQGWNATVQDGQTVIDTAASMEDLFVPVGGKDPAKATENVYVASNLNKLTDINETHRTTYDVYDAFGNAHQLQVSYARVTDANGAEVPNQWIATVTLFSGVDGTIIEPTLAVNEANPDLPAGVSFQAVPAGLAGNQLVVNFDNQGTIADISDSTGGIDALDMLNINVSFDVPGSVQGEDGVAQTQTIAINFGEQGSYTNATTQFAAATSNKIVGQDGYGLGYLEDFVIDNRGIITGTYSNGTRRSLGQIAMASFANSGALEKVGDTNFVASNNSGDPNIGVAGEAGKGSLVAGALEMSNVDLAEQFTDMIVTQRGFQANSRTITTSDQLLQELLNLK